MESKVPKRILVIDGGGMRGLGCLIIVDEIMNAVATRARKRMRPCEVFDIICGTSVGGFIAILLGRLGMDCPTAIECYKEAVKKLVHGQAENIWDNIAYSRFLNTAMFDEYMAKIVGDICGSTDIPMKAAIEDGQDPHKHPITKIQFEPSQEAILTELFPDFRHDNGGSTRLSEYYTHHVVAATLATPIYVQPLKVKADNSKEYSFQDAGFGGYNNPIHIALKEYQSNWPQGRVETVVSLGTGLQGLFSELSQQPPTSNEWAPIPPYVKQICKTVYGQKLRNAERNEDVDLNVTYAIRELARIAADSNVAHCQVKAKRAAHCDNYYRIDEAFGLDYFELIDADQVALIRGKVKNWIEGNGKQIITEIASKLVEERKNFEKKEDAISFKPPPPPRETVGGYNYLLDEPRPTDIREYLRNYEVLFIVDDSASMTGERWTEAEKALVDIADYALKLQTKTVGLRFLNDPTIISGLQGVEKLKSIFNKVTPSNGTPTGSILATVFDEHLRRIRTAISNKEYSKVPPLDIIILTDGVPSDSPADVIAEAVSRINEAHYHPNTMGVQIVQIGDEDNAKAAIKELVKGNNGNIVDTVPYRGVVTSDKLQRILLGGIHPNVRAQIPLEWLAME